MSETITKPKEKKEKPDFKQQLLEHINKNYGLPATVAIEDLLKQHSKQVGTAMQEGGVPATSIAKDLGIDLEQVSSETKGTPEDSKEILSKLVTPKKGNFWHTPFQVDEKTGEVTPESILGGLIEANPRDTLAMVEARAKSKKAMGTGDVSSMLADLSPEQQIQAVDLSRRIAGVRGVTNVLPAIAEKLKMGVPIDQIEDELRLSNQSSGFSGDMRNAAQQMMIGKSKSERNDTFDSLDDLVQQGDVDSAKGYLKKMALKDAGIDQGTRMAGKERTLELLGEVKEDMKTLEKNGFPTGFFSGNTEAILAKVGQVQNPEMRKLATKIATALISYRRDMTGVQFGEKEARDYKVIFPSIDKVGKFNTANINALEEVFTGDLDKFYSLQMGKKNYDKLFKGESKSKEVAPGYSSDEWEVVQ